MAEEKSKPKVYVETTVVSDATALPTNDLVLAGRQYITREWWKTARERFDLHSSVPKEYPDDALHIATAATNGLDFLVSWNFKHITNANTIPLIERICEENGYQCPCICTPQMLQEGGRE